MIVVHHALRVLVNSGEAGLAGVVESYSCMWSVFRCNANVRKPHYQVVVPTFNIRSGSFRL